MVVLHAAWAFGLSDVGKAMPIRDENTVRPTLCARRGCMLHGMKNPRNSFQEQ